MEQIEILEILNKCKDCGQVIPHQYTGGDIVEFILSLGLAGLITWYIALRPRPIDTSNTEY